MVADTSPTTRGNTRAAPFRGPVVPWVVRPRTTRRLYAGPVSPDGPEASRVRLPNGSKLLPCTIRATNPSSLILTGKQASEIIRFPACCLATELDGSFVRRGSHEV